MESFAKRILVHVGFKRKLSGLMFLSIETTPEGPYIPLLGNYAPKCHAMEGIMGPNSLMAIYVDPLGTSNLQVSEGNAGEFFANDAGERKRIAAGFFGEIVAKGVRRHGRDSSIVLRGTTSVALESPKP